MYQNSSAVEQYYSLTRGSRSVCMGKIKLWVLLGTVRVHVWPFDVSVSRAGSMTSNDGMRGEVYCRCVGRRPIQFETEICYLEFKDW